MSSGADTAARSIGSPPGNTSYEGGRLRSWLFRAHPGGDTHEPRHTASWWQVMCLTGVDYFSTLGYQPGIAFLAAGLLSPLATLILVLLTLLGALPIYCRIAERSPDGDGSLALLEDLLPRWRGKTLVLCLLGFAATDFVITITLSAADATAHIIENPFVPRTFERPVLMTLLLLAALSAVFLKGFREAIGVAVAIVITYLLLNAVVLTSALLHLWQDPAVLANWRAAVWNGQRSTSGVMLAAALLFPKLALGLSGFETGVVVMPLVRGDPDDVTALPIGRIRNTKHLLTSAALIMSVMLLASSMVTTLLVPRDAFAPGGAANGRALAYLAHAYLGEAFGTAYDLSTISILWFAGASAMAGLLNLVPRYLPRYGMAPEWTKATRPLVLVVTAIMVVVTLVFDASVDAQAGAYATGVLVLMTSAGVAVTLAARRDRQAWLPPLAITLVLLYTTITNVVERPEGLKIATFFIGAIIVMSLVSRTFRATELRVEGVWMDLQAERFVDDAAVRGAIRIIANRPDRGTKEEYDAKVAEARESHHLDPSERILFLEVQLSDASDFRERLGVRGFAIGGHRVLRCTSPAVPNAIAALLLAIRDRTGGIPHAYFGWTEGSPLTYVLKYLALGEGDTAPVTREVLRLAEPEADRRPRIHVA